VKNGSRAAVVAAVIGVPLLLAVGVVFGVWLQRSFGMGTLLRSAGVLPPGPAPTATRTPAGLPVEYQGKLLLFALAGQSNMSGWSPLLPQQELHPRAFLFGNDYRWRQAQEPTDHPEGQVDLVSLDQGSDLGTSPGLAFAQRLLELQPEAAVGLIPCAKGDTTIAQWQRGLADDTLYGSCLKRIAAASSMGELAGVLFFQGESDALDPQQAGDRIVAGRDYGLHFTQYIADLRRDLQRPLLPFVFAQIGSQTAPEAYTNWAIVQDEQASVDLPCTAMITTEDLALHDGVHYTPESYQEIGRRFADAYAALVETQACK
jgi:hypothetical protein